MQKSTTAEGLRGEALLLLPGFTCEFTVSRPYRLAAAAGLAFAQACLGQGQRAEEASWKLVTMQRLISWRVLPVCLGGHCYCGCYCLGLPIW